MIESFLLILKDLFISFAQLPLISFIVGAPSETVVRPLQVGSPDCASK